MERNHFILAAAVISAGLAIGTVAIAQTSGPNAAAWLQGIGTVAAVWAAVWTANNAQKRDNDRHDSHGRVIALHLEPTVISINNAIIKASEYADETNMGETRRFVDDVSIIRNHLSGGPQLPADLVRDAWMFPKPLARALILLSLYHLQYTRLADDYCQRIRLLQGQGLTDAIGSMQISMSAVSSLSTDARKLVHEFTKPFRIL